ncbi:hypothetical protein HK405_013311 [Cladochytrium tenue]|nr:hypothetical protein HK405_013311 [Cladochytrium tenue]
MRLIPVAIDVVLLAIVLAAVRRAGNFGKVLLLPEAIVTSNTNLEIRTDRIKNLLLRLVVCQLFFLGDLALDALAAAAAQNLSWLFEPRRLAAAAYASSPARRTLMPASITTSPAAMTPAGLAVAAEVGACEEDDAVAATDGSAAPGVGDALGYVVGAAVSGVLGWAAAAVDGASAAAAASTPKQEATPKQPSQPAAAAVPRGRRESGGGRGVKGHVESIERGRATSKLRGSGGGAGQLGTFGIGGSPAAWEEAATQRSGRASSTAR